MLWFMPIIPAFGRLRQEDHKFKSQPELHSEACLERKKEKKKKTERPEKPVLVAAIDNQFPSFLIRKHFPLPFHAWLTGITLCFQMTHQMFSLGLPRA
jgi:hypothetical protein